MRKKITCVLCPNGCEILVEYENNMVKELNNALCDRGKEYAMTEVSNPQRTLTTTVKVDYGEFPLVSVRLEGPIPLSILQEVINDISKITIEAPVVTGQVVVEKIKDTSIKIVATGRINRVITN